MASPPVSRLHLLPPAITSTPNTPAITKLQSLLRQLVRVSTTDGRIFIGTFAGTDKPLNIILNNAEEYRSSSRPCRSAVSFLIFFRIHGSDELPDGRYVSLVMVPWKIVTSIEAPSRWLEEHGRSASPLPSMYC